LDEHFHELAGVPIQTSAIRTLAGELQTGKP